MNKGPYVQIPGDLNSFSSGKQKLAWAKDMVDHLIEIAQVPPTFIVERQSGAYT